jgi:hypothetical protein
MAFDLGHACLGQQSPELFQVIRFDRMVIKRELPNAGRGIAASASSKRMIAAIPPRHIATYIVDP